MKINFINPKKIKKYGPYSLSAILSKKLLFTSGQISPNNNTDYIKGVSRETKEILQKIKLILKKANFKVSHIFKTTIFITKIKNMKQVNRIYKKFFLKNKSSLPTRSCIEVNKLPKNAKIEIEAIAYK